MAQEVKSHIFLEYSFYKIFAEFFVWWKSIKGITMLMVYRDRFPNELFYLIFWTIEPTKPRKTSVKINEKASFEVT